MSERQVRLLYTTTCHTCGASVSAGTTTWWDDDRAHATCTDCMAERVDGAATAPLPLDRRSRRRLEIVRAHRPHLALR